MVSDIVVAVAEVTGGSVVLEVFVFLEEFAVDVEFVVIVIGFCVVVVLVLWLGAVVDAKHMFDTANTVEWKERRKPTTIGDIISNFQTIQYSYYMNTPLSL